MAPDPHFWGFRVERQVGVMPTPADSLVWAAPLTELTCSAPKGKGTTKGQPMAPKPQTTMIMSLEAYLNSSTALMIIFINYEMVI